MMLWTEQFATGSDRIDLQHRTLINHVNHLEELLTTTNPSREECEFVIQLLDFLENYARTHFEFEEQCMARYRCPAHEKNKQAHEQFRMFSHEFKARYQAEGFRREIILCLHTTISRWIEGHILQLDVQLGPAIKSWPQKSTTG